jgi:hypothetical protein
MVPAQPVATDARAMARSMSISVGFPVPPEESAGRLLAADLHDAGRRHPRGESGQPLAGARSRRTDADVHKSLKVECIRTGGALSLECARRPVKRYVEKYNNARNSAIGYITPKKMLAGLQKNHRQRGRMTDETDYFRFANHPEVGETSQYKSVCYFLSRFTVNRAALSALAACSGKFGRDYQSLH